ncbi:GNAT family N-acetyltransferase [Aestuariivivens sediminicola]|uniref:GNAT family N-acetyltransferase n=1 Tax=Aestuariivivens sediminicola TaxID=2913560 RepID=UPI001F570A70|nr:GNAT family N-acetyltransferase [Aestuariivivens sediminicola]
MKEDLVILLSLIDEKFKGSLFDSSVEDYCDKILKHATIVSIYKLGHIKAFIAYYDNNKESLIGYLSMLAVHPDYQDKGYGKQLMHMAIDALRKLNFKHFDLEVDVSNKKAIALYSKFGFELIRLASGKKYMRRNL